MNRHDKVPFYRDKRLRDKRLPILLTSLALWLGIVWMTETYPSPLFARLSGPLWLILSLGSAIGIIRLQERADKRREQAEPDSEAQSRRRTEAEEAFRQKVFLFQRFVPVFAVGITVALGVGAFGSNNTPQAVLGLVIGVFAGLAVYGVDVHLQQRYEAGRWSPYAGTEVGDRRIRTLIALATVVWVIFMCLCIWMSITALTSAASWGWIELIPGSIFMWGWTTAAIRRHYTTK